MSERRIFVLSHELARRRAIETVQAAPRGYIVQVQAPTRNLDINAALHALIGEIADRVEYAGRHWDIETWKRLLVASWCRANSEQVVVLPALDGAGVDIVFRRTAQMTQGEVRDLMAFIESWMAERPEFADGGE